MTVFNTFWKVVKKNKGIIILYTVLLIAFGGINLKANTKDLNFVNSKPDILIINHDDGIFSKNLIKYMKSNSNILKIKEDEDSINDALFYRDVNYVIYIPKNYSNDVENGMNPQINVKSTKDYNASLAEMILNEYIRVQNVYSNLSLDRNSLINLINSSLEKRSKIKIESKLDTEKLANVTSYFNFASYSIMAIIIFIICLVLSSFKIISKRTIISSMSYKKYNRMLLLSSLIYSLIVWFIFILLGIFIFKGSLLTLRGVIYIINTFIFTFCSLTIALLISTVVSDKNAINGIVNVISLGSAFLCGAFVPAEYLPDFVLKISHVLPAYWYINSNNLLKKIENINIASLEKVFINFIVLIIFSITFLVINNIFSKRYQKVD